MSANNRRVKKANHGKRPRNHNARRRRTRSVFRRA
jgi:hypothetical protein